MKKKKSKKEIPTIQNSLLVFNLSKAEVITIQKALASRFLSIQSDYFERIKELENSSPFVAMMREEIRDLEHLYKLFTFTND